MFRPPNSTPSNSLDYLELADAAARKSIVHYTRLEQVLYDLEEQLIADPLEVGRQFDRFNVEERHFRVHVTPKLLYCPSFRILFEVIDRGASYRCLVWAFSEKS